MEDGIREDPGVEYRAVDGSSRASRNRVGKLPDLLSRGNVTVPLDRRVDVDLLGYRSALGYLDAFHLRPSEGELGPLGNLFLPLYGLRPLDGYLRCPGVPDYPLRDRFHFFRNRDVRNGKLLRRRLFHRETGGNHEADLL